MTMTASPAMFQPGLHEGLIVLAIVLLLFGAKRIPELARSLGKSLNEFKKGKQEGTDTSTPESTPDVAPKDDTNAG